MTIERFVATIAIAAAGAAASSPARAQTATGRIEGTVVDEVTGEPLFGVSVIATSPALTGAPPSALTDERGGFVLDALSSGTYLVTFYYADLTFHRPSVVVAAGSPVVIAQAIEVTPPPPGTAVALVGGGTWLGDRAPSAGSSTGGGAEVLLLAYEHERTFDGLPEGRDPWLAEAGGFAVAGRGGARRRDVIDVHARAGVAWFVRPWLQPYLAGGADLLQITSHDVTGTARGTTLGLSIVAGVLGRASAHLEYSVTAGWTQAVVPGTGDALDAFVVQVALGGRFHVKGSYP